MCIRDRYTTEQYYYAYEVDSTDYTNVHSIYPYNKKPVSYTHLDVYKRQLCYQRGGSLLHCPSTLTVFRHYRNRRYISVALSLESPPPDVIRHPAL